MGQEPWICERFKSEWYVWPGRWGFPAFTPRPRSTLQETMGHPSSEPPSQAALSLHPIRTPRSLASTLLSTIVPSEKVPTFRKVSLHCNTPFPTFLQLKFLLDPLAQALLQLVASEALGRANGLPGRRMGWASCSGAGMRWEVLPSALHGRDK